MGRIHRKTQKASKMYEMFKHQMHRMVKTFRDGYDDTIFKQSTKDKTVKPRSSKEYQGSLVNGVVWDEYGGELQRLYQPTSQDSSVSYDSWEKQNLEQPKKKVPPGVKREQNGLIEMNPP